MKRKNYEIKISLTISYVFPKTNEWIINPIHTHFFKILIYQLQAKILHHYHPSYEQINKCFKICLPKDLVKFT